MSDDYAQRLRDFMDQVSALDSLNASFSQLGEDRVLWWLFGTRHDGFYVDIGCHKPYRFSNTALLHLKNGWSGVNVDVDDRSIAAFKLARPHDVNICAAVGGAAGKLEVTMFEHGEFNTLDPHRSVHPNFASFLSERRLVDVIPLRDILSTHVAAGQQIDLLNVDIEGLDYEALASNDWIRFRPEAVAVEIHGFNLADPTSSPTYQLLEAEGYDLLAHVVATTIFRRRPA